MIKLQTYHNYQEAFFRKGFLIGMFLFQFFISQAQTNLIKNGDFETYHLPLSPQKDIDYQYFYKNWITCKDWYAGNSKAVLSEFKKHYKNLCTESCLINYTHISNGSFSDSIHTFKYNCESGLNRPPGNCDSIYKCKDFVGYSQFGRSTSAITCLEYISDSIKLSLPRFKSKRSYFGTQLKQPLVVGQSYEMKFKVLFNSASSISQVLGALFSTYKVQQTNNDVIKLTPQYQ